jgi:hypothetical protein
MNELILLEILLNQLCHVIIESLNTKSSTF